MSKVVVICGASPVGREFQCGLEMNPLLPDLVAQARMVVMTAADWQEQEISFAYGNAKMENDRITRQMARDAICRQMAPADAPQS